MENTKVSIINIKKGGIFLAFGNNKLVDDSMIKFDKAINIKRFSSQANADIAIDVKNKFTIDELVERLIELEGSPTLIVPIHNIESIYEYESYDSKKRLERELKLCIELNDLKLGVIGLDI